MGASRGQGDHGRDLVTTAIKHRAHGVASPARRHGRLATANPRPPGPQTTVPWPPTTVPIVPREG